jgi:hypothetical protein
MTIQALALATFVSIAMSPATAQTQQSEPTTLHATSRLVQLNVLAHDSKGAPVRDLTKDDFVVLDQGRPRPLAISDGGATSHADCRGSFTSADS